jgi:hypothetical protein
MAAINTPDFAMCRNTLRCEPERSPQRWMAALVFLVPMFADLYLHRPPCAFQRRDPVTVRRRAETAFPVPKRAAIQSHIQGQVWWSITKR